MRMNNVIRINIENSVTIRKFKVTHLNLKSKLATHGIKPYFVSVGRPHYCKCQNPVVQYTYVRYSTTYCVY